MKRGIRKLVIASVFFRSAILFGDMEIRAKVVTRNDQGKPEISEKILPNLISAERLDGRHFKIVRGTTGEAVATNGILFLKAATVYYNMNHSRSAIFEKFPSLKKVDEQQITVRLEIPDNTPKEKNFELNPENFKFNTALSFHEPGSPPEIWFRPLSPEKVPSTLKLLAATFQKQPVFSLSMAQALSRSGVTSLTNSNEIGSLKRSAIDHAARLGLTLGFANVFRNSKSESYADTAFVPEISSHEFAHHVLSDRFPLDSPDGSSPIAEGYADYLAAIVADSHKIGYKFGNYSNKHGKNGERKAVYSPIYEYLVQHDFVFGLLWGLRKEFGSEQADQVVIHARMYLNTGSDIRVDLGRALVSASQDLGWTTVDQIRIRQYLERRGF